MSKAKGIVIVVVAVIVVAVLAVGGAYLATSAKQKRASARLKQAKNLLANNKIDDGLELLRDIVANYAKTVSAPEATFLLATTLREQKTDSHEAASLFERILKQYPQSPYARKALYFKALGFLDKRPYTEDTEAFFKDIIRKLPGTQTAYVARFALALDDLESGNLLEAKNKMDALLERLLPDEIRSRLEDTLGGLNFRILFSPEAYDSDEYYTIKKGDYIYKLAQKYKLTPELLMRCNNISDPKRISIGQRIKIPHVSFSLLVNRYDNTLTLLSNGKFFRKYPVRTGAYGGQTPIGDFKIQNKKKNPRWVNPQNHKVYPPGDPENELGTRWMSFERDMLGIHSTIKPETVGYYASNGCIGMYREDVEELYDLIPFGTPLRIVGRMNPEIIEKSKELGFRK